MKPNFSEGSVLWSGIFCYWNLTSCRQKTDWTQPHKDAQIPQGFKVESSIWLCEKVRVLLVVSLFDLPFEFLLKDGPTDGPITYYWNLEAMPNFTILSYRSKIPLVPGFSQSSSVVRPIGKQPLKPAEATASACVSRAVQRAVIKFAITTFLRESTLPGALHVKSTWTSSQPAPESRSSSIPSQISSTLPQDSSFPLNP